MPADVPAPSPAPQRRSSCLTSALALAGLVGASTFLLILPTGFIGPVFVLGGIGIFGLFTFHYFVWGRWLKLELDDSKEPADDEDTQ